jgi:hypothetical protein
VSSGTDLLERLISVYEEDEADPRHPYLIRTDEIDRYRTVVDELLDPDIEVDLSNFRFLAPGMEDRYRGIEGWWEFWRSWLAEWDDYRFAIAESTEIDGIVLLDVEIAARGRASGAPVETSICQVWRLRGDLLASLRVFASHERALAALEHE